MQHVMSNVVHLKWGEEPAPGVCVLVTRIGRVRGDDYYVHTPGNRPIGEARSWAGEAYASLRSALREAHSLATQRGAETIYVRMP